MTSSSFVVITCSSPWHGRGGASRVISSYIDYYFRKKVLLKICLFHFMHKYRIFRVLPSVKSLFYALTLPFSRQQYSIHHHHTSLFDLVFLILFKFLSFSSRDCICVTFIIPNILRCFYLFKALSFFIF